MKVIGKMMLLLSILFLSLLSVSCTFFQNTETTDTTSSTSNIDAVTVPTYVSIDIVETIQVLQSTLSSSRTQKLLMNSIDQDNPFDNVDGERIEDLLESQYPSTTNVVYDTQLNEYQSFYVHIKLKNPSSVDITSVTINGIQILSSNFDQGSSSEDKYIYNPYGNPSGLYVYQLDEITYNANGEEGKITLPDNTSTVLGVTYESSPEVQVFFVYIEENSLIVQIGVQDESGIWTTTDENFLKLVLFDGTDIISEVSVGNGVRDYYFENLISGSMYQIALVSYLDYFDGEGSVLTVFSAFAFYAESITTFENIEVSSETVSFDIVNQSPDFDGEISRVLLKQNGAVIDLVVDFSNLSFGDLLSNNTYQIQSTFESSYGQMKVYWICEQDFTTLMKANPALSFENTQTSSDEIIINFFIWDLDNTISGSSIYVYRESNLVFQTQNEMENIVVSTLESNTSYLVRACFEIDLNDGMPVTSTCIEHEFTTLKQLPMPSILLYSLGTTTANYNIEVSDPDEAILSYEVRAEIVTYNQDPDAEDVIQVIDLGNSLSQMITSLDSNRTHTIIYQYSYQLNESGEIYNAEVEYEFSTLKMEPIFVFSDVQSALDGVDVELYLENEDNQTVTNIQFTLWDSTMSTIIAQDTNHETEATTSWITYFSVAFDQLLSNTEYILIAQFDYPMMDNTGIGTKQCLLIYKTLAYQTPTISFSSVSSDADSIDVVIQENDPEQLGILQNISISENDQVIESKPGSLNETFGNLNSLTEYLVTAIYEYNLKDGFGSRVQEITYSIKTKHSDAEIVSVDSPDYGIAPNTSGYISIQFGNLAGAFVTAIYINEVRYGINNSSSSTFTLNLGILSEIGPHEFVINRLDFLYDNESCSTYFVTNNRIVIDVIGSIDFISYDMETPLDLVSFAIDGENPGYLIFEIQNEFDYSVYGLTIHYQTHYFHQEGWDYWIVNVESTHTYSASEIIQIDSTHFKVLWYGRTYFDQYSVNDTFNITNIVYGVSDNRNISIDKTFSGIAYVMNSFTPIDIYTVQELQNMDNGYVYVLKADLDFTDFNWEVRDFHGVLLGEDHTIRNMNLNIVCLPVGTMEYDQVTLDPLPSGVSYRFGLFGNVTGGISSLSIRESSIVITVLPTDGYALDDSMDVGLLAGSTMNAFIDNVLVHGTIQINAENYDCFVSVGGIAGHINSIDRSTSYVNIEASSMLSVSVGLIGGYIVSVHASQAVGQLYITSDSIVAGGIGGSVQYASQNQVSVGMDLVCTRYAMYVGALAGSTASGLITDNKVYDSIIIVGTSNLEDLITMHISQLVGSLHSGVVERNIVECDIFAQSDSSYASMYIGTYLILLSNPLQSIYIENNVIIGWIHVENVGSVVLLTNIHPDLSGITLMQNYIFDDYYVSINNDDYELMQFIEINVSQMNDPTFFIGIGYSTEIWSLDGLDIASGILPSIIYQDEVN